MCLRRIHKREKKSTSRVRKKQKKCQSRLSCVSFYLVPLLLYLLLRDSSVLNCLPGMNKWKKGEKKQRIDPWWEGKPQGEEGGGGKGEWRKQG